MIQNYILGSPLSYVLANAYKIGLLVKTERDNDDT